MAKMVLGVFTNRFLAEDTLLTLEDNGYSPADVSIIMKDGWETRKFAVGTGIDAASGAVSNATTGGVLGALAGLMVGVGIVPGLGALLIGGPLAAALGLTGTATSTLSGAATGVLAGGILGALAGLGLTDVDAKIYEESIRDGGILLAIPARSGEVIVIKTILADYGANQIRSISADEDQKSRQIEDKRMAPAYLQRSFIYFSEVDQPRARKRRSRK